MDNILGILMDESKKIVVLYSNQYIQTFSFPSMQFMETISLQQYNDTSIQRIFLNTEMSVMTVQTQNRLISFDLAEILYSSENSLLKIQKIQSLSINQFKVSYSLVNLSLNLYQDTVLIDTLLFEPNQQNLYPYLQELILIQNNQIAYITYQNLNIIKVDLLKQKLVLLVRIQLQKIPDNYLYDYRKNQIFLLNEQQSQISFVNLTSINPQETDLIKLNQGDTSQSLILDKYIIIPSRSSIQIYDLDQGIINSLDLQNDVVIKFIFKLQSKSSQVFYEKWWDIPFDYNERYNNYDSQQQRLLCLVIQEKEFQALHIVNADTNNIINTYQIKYANIVNIVSDYFRQLIYLVNNQGQTLVFSYALKLLTTFQNACLKQAKISYDTDFIYSICPNDIIIYNGISFKLQFPKINEGVKEVINFVNIKYNNHFLIVQKNKLSIIKLDFVTNYQLIFEINVSYQQLLSLKIFQQNYLSELEILLSSYNNTQNIRIPLQQTEICSIEVQQQTRPLESIYTDIQLGQSLQSVQMSNQKLSLIQIYYSEGSCIQEIKFDQLQDKNIDKNYQITLLSSSYSQKYNICWDDNQNFPLYIQNFYLNNINLNIVSQIDLNKKKQMKNFQIVNATLQNYQPLILSDFEQVLIKDVKFDSSSQTINQITIKNCKLVVLESLEITNIQADQILFNIYNNTNIIIQRINIYGLNQVNIFLIDNNQSITISNFNISYSSFVEVIQVQQVNQLMISDFIIFEVFQSSIIHIYGSVLTQIYQINVGNSSQIFLIQIEPYIIDNFQLLSQEFLLQNMSLINSTNILTISQTVSAKIQDVFIDQLNLSMDLFSLVANELSIDNIDIKNSNKLKLINSFFKYTFTFFLITNYYECKISNLSVQNSNITALLMNQQSFEGLTEIKQSKFIQFNIENPLIQFESIGYLIIDTVTVVNVNLLGYDLSSVILINKCFEVQILNSNFKNNTNLNGYAGVIYLHENNINKIENSTFEYNQCYSFNGGALSVINSVNRGYLRIFNSIFKGNQALFSTGGAINLVHQNLILANTTISLNRALIGGGIYYQQTIPDFVLDLEEGITNQNNITENFATFYGKNVGSTLRKIQINTKDVKSSQNSTASEQSNSNIQINQFKSGDQIYLEKIQLLDEENNPIQIQNIDLTNFKLFSSDVQTLIDQLSVSLQYDQQDDQIQCIGVLESKQLVDNGFKLNAQVIYQPLSQVTLQVASNNFPQILDSKGNIYINQSQLYKNITFYFDNCELGQIVKKQRNSIVCEECPEGKYSLNINDNQCSICPQSALKCYQSTLLLKNGYWRENNNTDLILYCSSNPEACQPESPQSKQNCIEGYIGPLCSSCDTYGEIWDTSFTQLFSSGKCYSCEKNISVVIAQNLILFLVTFCYVYIILKNVISKLQAKLVGYFICKSDILFLGSTCKFLQNISLIKSDKPSIVSKILTDHLQILSLISFFSVNVPNYFIVPIQFSGNALSVSSKSIDCVLSQLPNLKPLWFYQSLWSLVLPLSLIFVYLMLGAYYKFVKKSNQALRYLNTACVFIYLYFFPTIITIISRSFNCKLIGNTKYFDLDVNIRCLDPVNHTPYILYFSLPLLLLLVFAIPLYLLLKIRSGKKQKWSIFVEIKYSFIFAGYKEKYYYWEFGKLIYKQLLILVSILLQQNQLIRICCLNALILFQIFITFKFKPYVIKNFNNLLQQSSVISAFSLNLTSIISNTSNLNISLQTALMMLLVIPNLKLILQLVIGISLITISSDVKKRSKFKKLLYYLKQKFPSYFENIQIQNSNKIRCLMKIQKVKSKIKILISFLKNYNFYGQESLQQHLSLQKSQRANSYQSNNCIQNRPQNLTNTFSIIQNTCSQSIMSPKNLNSETLNIYSPKSKFFLQQLKDRDQKRFKSTDSFKSMRDKWSYYTRRAKHNAINQLNLDQQIQNYDNNKDFVTDDTESLNMKTGENRDNLQNSEIKELLTKEI